MTWLIKVFHFSFECKNRGLMVGLIRFISIFTKKA